MDRKTYIIITGGILFIILILIIFNISNLSNFAIIQKKDILNEGNEFYDKGQYENALGRYNALLFLDSLNYETEYNKANTYCRKKRFDLADSTYQVAARKCLTVNKNPDNKDAKDFLSIDFHNKGNANMAQVPPIDTIMNVIENQNKLNSLNSAAAQPTNQYLYNNLLETLKIVQAAISDYKNSLRNVSTNDSTRYNLAYAQDYEKKLLDILKDMTPPDNQSQQNQDQQDQQNQDNNDKEDERRETDQKNGEKDPNADLSLENAEQILKAMEKDEENTLKKVRLQRDKSQQRRIEKNW
ncbi:MAG: hypothetical protein J6T67_09280 [Paludibacteraceae bacterium]|nr:hypothetical protein [Paludibacteraceae bacterium]MBR4713223.1 hypothetical protein [Paludibacteraceae bacterium]